MSSWMMSPTGQAVAAWGSDVLAVVALVVALAVAIVEQRRANGDRRADALSEQSRRDAFITAALDISVEALDLIDEFTSRAEQMPVTVQLDYMVEELRPNLTPMIDVIWSLRQAAPFDAGIALSLAKIFRIMEAAKAHPVPIHREVFVKRLGTQRSLLAAELKALRAERSTEA